MFAYRYTREFFLHEYGVASIANNKLLSFRGGIAKHADKFKVGEERKRAREQESTRAIQERYRERYRDE